MRKIYIRGSLANAEGNVIHATGISYNTQVLVGEDCTANAPDGCVYRGKVVRVDLSTKTYDADIYLNQKVRGIQAQAAA